MLNVVKPKGITLEASSVCQLKCPSCPRFTDAFQSTIGSGFLKLREFQRLLDRNPWIRIIEISNYGEIFLNPAILDIIEHAYKRNVILKANGGANLNNVKENVLEGLVKFKFRRILCSIDGASDGTYRLYRINGNFESVIENIKKINHFKRKYRSKYPLLVWNFVVFGHNEHEIPIARKKANELGMQFHPKLTWDETFSPIRDKEFVKKEMGLDIVSRREYKQKYGVSYGGQLLCHQLWETAVINWDGKMLGCCRNFWGDFGGNAFEDSILECVNNNKMQSARDMLLGRKIDTREDIPCSSCDVYITMRTNDKWLKRGLLKKLKSNLPLSVYNKLCYVYDFFKER